MNKKILVAAIGAALSVGVAAAQAAEVKISGYGNVSLDMIKGKNAAGTNNDSNLGVSSNSSNVVVSATEDLGGGLTGVFSLQEYFRLDNTGNSSTDKEASRTRNSGGNSYVGIAGSFGTVLAGAHDTPAKLVGRSVDLFGNQIGDSRNLGVANTRAQNVVAYLSPSFSGFSFALAHVTNLDNAVENDVSTTANAAMAQYQGGPVSVGLGWDKADIANTSNDLTWTVLAGSFGPFAGAKINALWQTFKLGSAKVDTKGIGVSYKFGDNTVKAQYYMTDPDGADNNGKLMAIGFDHAFSKAFTGYVAYATTSNDSLAAFSMSGGGHGDDAGTVAGKNPNGFSVGTVFKF